MQGIMCSKRFREKTGLDNVIYELCGLFFYSVVGIKIKGKTSFNHKMKLLVYFIDTSVFSRAAALKT